MTGREPRARKGPCQETRPAGDQQRKAAEPPGQEVEACDETTATKAASAEPETAWSELGFDQALATRCALYGWTAHRVSDYLCRDHGDADPLDTILNGCDPLEALSEHAIGGDDQ